MKRNLWYAVGYFQVLPSDLIVLPIFSDGTDGLHYAQFAFSSSNRFFELSSVEAESFSRFETPVPADPQRLLYVGLRIGDHVKIVERATAQRHLQDVALTDLEDSAKIQYLEIAASASNVKAHVAIDQADFSFLATLSAQHFIDRALASAKEEGETASVVKEVIHCSRWVTDWTLDRVPEERLSALMSHLTVSRAQLEAALSEEMALSSAWYSPLDPDQKINPATTAVATISRLRRQELRISQLLRIVVLDGAGGRETLKRYAPQTKYEDLIYPMLIGAAQAAADADAHTREMLVARLISKIFVKYFPVRRGRFIVDFLRVLGDFPIIREQLASIYEQKIHTYGVQMYSNVIKGILNGEDDVSLHYRRMVPPVGIT